MILKLKRTPGIYLVGFMGSGKSTVARLLAKELGWHFIDLDHDIEADQRTTISQLFETQGEQAFRVIETATLQKRIRKIQTGWPSVLALGGGTFTLPHNRELVSNNGVSIWLDCPFSVIRERLAHSNHRPLARDPDQLEELYNSRRTAYAEADYHIPVPCNDSQAALAAVLQLPLF